MGSSVLLVLDDAQLGDALADDLTRRRLCVAVARDAAEALCIGGIACFTLAVIDMRRADLHGPAIASELRAMAHQGALRIIALVDERTPSVSADGAFTLCSLGTLATTVAEAAGQAAEHR